jgi:formylglycine-generating enzyme
MRSMVALVCLVLGCAAIPAAAEPVAVHRILAVGHETMLTTTAPKVCPDGMVLVEGTFCPQPKEVCAEWLDKEGGIIRRCKRYEETHICLSATINKRFCIEHTEHLEANGSRLPIVNVDAYQAEAICKREGSRLCYESEHLAACQGTEWRPYPEGWERDCSASTGGTGCNCDTYTNLGKVDHRNDKRMTPEQTAGCVSQFGVIDLVGNADEWWRKDLSSSKYEHTLRSGHWMPIRAMCARATTAHSELYSANSVGFRCCLDLTDQ